MKPSRPLAYESLKTVLQYMEPNLRFKLATRIPSIASTEKAVPLKINKLQFEPYEFIVNGTSYKLGTYRHYRSGVRPLREHEDDNSKGGISWDLDRYGSLIVRDSAIGADSTGQSELITDQEARRFASEFEKELEVYEWIKTERLGYNVVSFKRSHPYYYKIESCKRRGIEFIRNNIDRLEAILAPLHCRLNKTRPPFSTMVQLTITDSNKKSEISRKPGTTKLYEVQKDLATRLFANRGTVPFVKHFEVGFGHQMPPQMVIGLPANIQIRVQEMSILRDASAVCDAVQSMIHSSSYPLERVRICNNVFYSSMHPIVCNAKKLFFADHSMFENGIFGFMQFNNQWVYMENNWFTPDQHITLLRNWIESRREIGTCFVSKIGEDWREADGKLKIVEIFTKCKEHLNGYDAGERSIKIPMSVSSEISLSYKFYEKQDEQPAQWMLAIKVVAV